jgi:hypothetical protein
MNDSWTQVLEAFEPKYQDLKRTMDSGPTIKPVLYQSGNKKWRVTLEEVWPAEVIDSGSFELDRSIAWVTEELNKWTIAKRMAWDSWDFPTRRDAERFIIIYNLTWGQ